MRSASRLRALFGALFRKNTEGKTRSRGRGSAPLFCGAWALLAVLHCGALHASETITYQYDALGRLTSTSRSGGTQTVYSIDAAGNRTQVQTTGVTTPSTPPWITVPASSTGSYTISWGASTSGIVTAYELYESMSSGFSPQSLAYSGTGTSLPVSSKPNGTYYYRVRACNASGYSLSQEEVGALIEAR